MKRKSFLVVFALLFAVLGLTACSKGALPEASFKEDEIVVSLKTETKDFFDDIDIQIEHRKLDFKFSRDLFSKNEDGTFKPIEAGQGQVFVCMGDEVLDSAKVIVKSQFSTPSFVSVDREGRLNWVDSYAFSPEGERVKATEYNLIIDGEEESAQVIHKGDKIPEDKFDGGVHEISLQAVESKEKYIDASEAYLQSVDFSIAPIEFTVESGDNFGEQTVTISWPKVGEKLTVSLKLVDKSFEFDFASGTSNKFLSFTDNIVTQSATINFQDFQAGEIDFILQRTFDQQKLFASDICQLYKLDSPQVEFADGEFNWKEINGASKYKVKATKSGLDETEEGEVELPKSNLNGFTPCEYSEVAVQAIGGWRDSVFYVNSDVTRQFDTFEKLTAPVYTYKVNGRLLEITFTEDGDYRVVLPNVTKEFKGVVGGQTKSVDLSEMGISDFEGETVKFDVYRTAKMEKQVLSDAVSHDIFVMDSFGQVTHTLVEGQSKFTFKNVFAGKVDYSVVVNGDNAQMLKFSSEGAEGENTDVEFQLDLKKYAVHSLGENKGYNIVITAYLENGYSVNSSVTKTIKVLNNVTPLERQNVGEFAWQAQQYAKYQYEIYDVDKAFYEGFDKGDYEQPQKSPINTPTPISDTKTQEVLDSGKYYFIKILTLSDGTSDEYLDSNFLDGKYFEAVFKYEQQIVSPTLKFNTETLGLEMTIVDHAEEYFIEISLQDSTQKQLTVYPHGQDTFIHTFSSTEFLNSGKYTISVVARVGESGDNIFTPSEKNQIFVTKLENPTFTVEGELLTVAQEKEDKADKLEIYHQKLREVLNSDGQYSITLSETEERYRGEFTLEMQYLAIENEGDNYYLNSEKVGYKFLRNDAPTGLDYTSPTLSFVNGEQNDVDHFVVTFELLSRQFTRNLETESVTYQEFVDAWTGENNEFGYIYDQWLKSDGQASINISVRAYKLGWNESRDKFILPSVDSEKFTLSKLMSPKSTFDTEGLKLSWTRLQSGTTYKIYVGSESAYHMAGSTTLDEWSLAEQDFSSRQEVWVVAENNKYLLTPKSNVISIKKLNISKQATISNETLILDFSDEKDLTDKVVVNETPDGNIETSQGRAVIDLTRVALPLRLQLQAVADTDSDYYIDSEVSTFNLEDLSNQKFEITYSGKDILWQAPATMVDAEGNNPISYILKIWRGDGLVDSIALTENKYSLTEEKFTTLQEGQYSLTVELVISDYLLNAGQTGYFGKPTCEKSGFSKLASVKDITHTIVEGEGEENSPDKLNKALVKVMWSDNWSEGVKFEMSLNGKTLEGTSGEGYNLTKDSGYTLALETSLFNEGENILVLTPNQDANVRAESFEYTITRYSSIQGLSINSDGVLTPLSDEISNFALAITPDGMSAQYQRFVGPTFDLLSILDRLESAKGHYSISVVGFDAQAKIVPSQEIKASGYRLVIKKVSIERDGSITIEILNEQESLQDLNFIAKYDGVSKNFAPSKSSDTIYMYSMLKFVELFEKTTVNIDFHIDIAVQKENYITSKWSGVEFNYRVADQEATLVRGQYLTDDYVKLVDSEGVQSSMIMLESDFVDTEGNNKTFNKTYQGDDATIKGYWVESKKGYSYFSSQIPEDEETYQECYAIRLASVYESAGAGEYKLRVSRIAYDSASSKYTQYNGKVFDIDKLESVKDDTLKLEDDILSWEAVYNVDVSGYYVYIYTKEELQRNLLQFELVSTASIENLQTLLSADVEYYIEVVAVSQKLGTLASNPTQEFHVYKYLPPCEVDVNEGNIQLSSAKVLASQLTSLVSSARSDTSLIESIANIRFKDFVTFNISTLAKENPKIRLEFRGDKPYYITMNALDLVPNLSLVLARIKTALDNTEQTMASYEPYQNVKAFYETMKKAGGGLANNRILFDDYGEEIPLGVYTVTVVQIGLGEFGTISSNASQPTELYVAPEPYTTLNSAEERGQYILRFRPIENKTSSSVSAPVEDYVLHLKGNVNYYFYIEKNELNSTYQIAKCIVEKDFNPREYIFTQPIPLEGTEEVAIDMKALSKYKLDNVSMVIEKAEYKTSVYGVGNNYSTSSKSKSVTVLYLDINPANITLKQGVLAWSMPKYNTVVSDFNTLVTYEKGSLSARTFTVEFVNNRATLNLDDTLLSDPNGLYRYVSLSVEGRILGDFMAVDSPVYRFNNVFRLYQPQVSVNGNIFNIEAPSENEGYSENYKISNNNSGNLWISRREGEYMAGVQGLTGSEDLQYKQTEKGATRFYFEGLGQTVETAFIVSASEVEGADYILSIADSQNIILSSKTLERDAKMLESVSGLQLEDGDLVWSDLANEENDVYKVTVEYYDEGTTMFTEPSVFYTTDLRFNTLLVQRQRPSEYYIFKVQKYHLLLSDNEGDITTLDGQYFTKDEVDNAGVYVLASEMVKLGDFEIKIRKTATPTQLQIRRGQISWLTEEGLSSQVVEGDANTIVKGSYSTQEGKTFFVDDGLDFNKNPYTIKVYTYTSGNFIKSDLATATLAGSTKVYKLPLLERGDFEIISQDVTEGTYQLDLSEFFNTHLIEHQNSIFKVRMHFKGLVISGATREDDYEYIDITSTKNNLAFTVNAIDNVVLRFQVIDATLNTESQSLMLINGKQSEEFNITPTGFSEDDEAWWNDEQKQFEWTYGKYFYLNETARLYTFVDGVMVDSMKDYGETGMVISLGEDVQNIDDVSYSSINYQGKIYYIKSQLVSRGESDDPSLFRLIISYTTGQPENVEVATKTYKPLRNGIITKVEIYARKDVSSLYSSPLVYTPDKNIDNMLFAGGDGSARDPYLVSSPEQFANIKFRNEGQKYYFKQTADLVLSQQHLFGGVFYGEYDGDEKNLTVNFSSLSEGKYSLTPIQNRVMNFDYYASLFEEIAPNAVFKNVNLNLYYGTALESMAIGGNSVLAGVAINNYGLVSSVNINSTIINTKSSASVYLAVAGLVGFNYKDISNCNIKSSPSMTATQRIVYAGVTLSNTHTTLQSGSEKVSYRGKIYQCFNAGNITVKSAPENSIVYVCGIAIVNDGAEISQCGNDGNITVQGTSFTNSVAGVVLRSNGSDSRLAYCYNNGTITSDASTKNHAGVCYEVVQSAILSLVSTPASLRLIATPTNPSYDSTQNPCYCNEGVGGSFTVLRLSDGITIDCKDGHSLHIKQEGSVYKAYIE